MKKDCPMCKDKGIKTTMDKLGCYYECWIHGLYEDVNGKLKLTCPKEHQQTREVH